MLRRLHHEQPDSFAFTPLNQKWAEAQMTKFPEGRQASAVIPLLWRVQEQEGWISRPALETVADMLGMAYIRVLEVATFYFMFQLQPVGSVAHIQVCGTTSCMICGAEDLIGVCKEKIAAQPHVISADGKFSWEEVECLGACANAPMVQIGKDFYEDLTTERFAEIIEEFAAGKVPTPGPQNGRYAAEPLGGATVLKDYEAGRAEHNASAALATGIGDTVKRIQGDEVPILTPWLNSGKKKATSGKAKPAPKDGVSATPKHTASAPEGAAKTEAEAAQSKGKPKVTTAAKAAEKEAPAVTSDSGVAEVAEKKPRTLKAPRKAGADDLKLIKGVGPKLEGVLNEMGFYHFDQIAKWGPEEVAWVDARLKFKGRIVRDNWIAKADELAKNKGKGSDS
ncbi:NADH-quinone oxidoreductase subunit E [Neptunicoccus cionae]|uniref:NADH-quinone oxidoreductase subunit E n=1 Tax=Neptunicoccus cionae TaxID=2035344 RepID=UPI000C76AC38|nr:NADH-quinone oxidoreductase subunit E [Amylibacter cionae]PLS22117.1 NADH-quinone oxidoreductase subunit NuoE [Amylibacter cionae]